MARIMGWFALVLALPLVVACAGKTSDAALPDFRQSSFEGYVQDTRLWLSKNRRPVRESLEYEVGLNAPFEIQPATPSGKAVLLVHGLTDSPYSFVDIASELAKGGYAVRTVLLQGHGSKPEDLNLPELEDWVQLVNHHTALLLQDYDEVWLGGYSTGGNLVLSEALQNPEVEGVLLFAPALEPDNKMVALAPWLKYLVDWADEDPAENIVKYDSLTMNGAAVYYETSERVMDQLESVLFDKPVFVAVSEADSVIDTGTLIDVFNESFIGRKQLVWFGGEPAQVSTDYRVFPMQLPEYRISNGSHMSLLYQRQNPLYGLGGLQLQCNNGQGEDAEQACRRGEPVWFSAWGHQEAGKVHARLTWNPYFDEMMQSMLQFMAEP